jgi:uncharacterized RDD family membrane protein YckC
MSDVQGEPTQTGAPPGQAPPGQAPPGQAPPGQAPPGQAPAVPASEMQSASGPSGPRAGFWRRFAAYFLDGLVLVVPSIIVVVILGNTAIANLITTLIALAYFVYFEGGPTGQTLGKKALGIRVLDLRAGGPIGYGRAVLRFIVRYISAIVFLLGYLWMLWDREKQTWHDKAAGSVVVPTDAYPVT